MSTRTPSDLHMVAKRDKRTIWVIVDVMQASEKERNRQKEKSAAANTREDELKSENFEEEKLTKTKKKKEKFSQWISFDGWMADDLSQVTGRWCFDFASIMIWFRTKENNTEYTPFQRRTIIPLFIGYFDEISKQFKHSLGIHLKSTEHKHCTETMNSGKSFIGESMTLKQFHCCFARLMLIRCQRRHTNRITCRAAAHQSVCALIWAKCDDKLSKITNHN